MRRTLLCSIAGAGTGFFAGFVIVQIFLQVLARETVPDNTGLVLILGVFLAGTGSIVGAIIGGIADLKELLKGKPKTPVKPQE